jgi:hypothetical protein
MKTTFWKQFHVASHGLSLKVNNVPTGATTATKHKLHTERVRIHSTRMKFLDAIVQLLKGQSHQIFKAIDVLHDDAAYNNLPKAIWRNVREIMELTEYWGAAKARGEWKHGSTIRATSSKNVLQTKQTSPSDASSASKTNQQSIKCRIVQGSILCKTIL